MSLTDRHAPRRAPLNPARARAHARAKTHPRLTRSEAVLAAAIASLLALGLSLALPRAAQACPTESAGAGCGGALSESGGGAKFVRVAPREIRTASLDGARRLSAPAPRNLLDPGAPLPDDYMMLLNSEYYGLPQNQDGWAYFHGDKQIYRVEQASRTVLERVTAQANRAW
ncbi:hypothetical protein ATO2_15020 [Roseovarius sp. 22II1-1F6A]|nr:hypothetical protein ATO2_15020 [Roseovarius sp. 22II1-1F6A]